MAKHTAKAKSKVKAKPSACARLLPKTKAKARPARPFYVSTDSGESDLSDRPKATEEIFTSEEEQEMADWAKEEQEQWE